MYSYSFILDSSGLGLISSKPFIQDQRVFPASNSLEINADPLEDEHTTAYYGGEVYNTNGLYVVSPPGASDNYGYLPTPPPPPPNATSSTSRYLYPETAGHLV